MNRRQLLAAEIHGYSYDNYHDHLGVNPRFDRYMPEAVDILESAADKAWPIEKVASALGVEINKAKEALLALERARKVVDAESPAESPFVGRSGSQLKQPSKRDYPTRNQLTDSLFRSAIAQRI